MLHIWVRCRNKILTSSYNRFIQNFASTKSKSNEQPSRWNLTFLCFQFFFHKEETTSDLYQRFHEHVIKKNEKIIKFQKGNERRSKKKMCCTNTPTFSFDLNSFCLFAAYYQFLFLLSSKMEISFLFHSTFLSLHL